MVGTQPEGACQPWVLTLGVAYAASLEALSLAMCLPSLEQHTEGDASPAAPEGGSCPLSAMDVVVTRVQATLAFQQRLIRLLPPKTGMPPLQGGDMLQPYPRFKKHPEGLCPFDQPAYTNPCYADNGHVACLVYKLFVCPDRPMLSFCSAAMLTVQASLGICHDQIICLSVHQMLRHGPLVQQGSIRQRWLHARGREALPLRCNAGTPTWQRWRSASTARLRPESPSACDTCWSHRHKGQPHENCRARSKVHQQCSQLACLKAGL